MNTLRYLPIFSTVLVFGGCYTQLAITNDEPVAMVDIPSTEIIQLPPVVVIIEPIAFSPPVYVPLPVGVVSTPAPATPSPTREIGNHRSDSGRTDRGDSDTRTSGSRRGGR